MCNVINTCPRQHECCDDAWCTAMHCSHCGDYICDEEDTDSTTDVEPEYRDGDQLCPDCADEYDRTCTDCGKVVPKGQSLIPDCDGGSWMRCKECDAEDRFLSAPRSPQEILDYVNEKDIQGSIEKCFSSTIVVAYDIPGRNGIDKIRAPESSQNLKPCTCNMKDMDGSSYLGDCPRHEGI